MIRTTPGITKLNQVGDTIIEVMICLAIMAMVIGAAYASATSSLRVGQRAQERTEAIKLSESQIEKIKYVSGNATSGVFDLPGTPFCLSSTNAKVVITDRLVYTPASYQQCLQNRYYIAVVYTPATNLFTVYAVWERYGSPIGPNPEDKYDTLKLFYRQPPDLAVAILPTPTPVGGTPTPPGGTPTPTPFGATPTPTPTPTPFGATPTPLPPGDCSWSLVSSIGNSFLGNQSAATPATDVVGGAAAISGLWTSTNATLFVSGLSNSCAIANLLTVAITTDGAWNDSGVFPDSVEVSLRRKSNPTITFPAINCPDNPFYTSPPYNYGVSGIDPFTGNVFSNLCYVQNMNGGARSITWDIAGMGGNLSDLELIIMADGNGNASMSPEIIGIADPVN